MARTIQEIKKEMTDVFINDENVIDKYKLDPKKPFEKLFSKVSIESILFYCVAVGIWTLEKLFDLHTKNVNESLIKMKPHTVEWYAEQAKQCADVDMAVAVEFDCVLLIKVAKYNENNHLAKLSKNELPIVKQQLSNIKDAGVLINVTSSDPSELLMDITIYYDSILMDDQGRTSNASRPVDHIIKDYLYNLPFNGEFRLITLIDKLQSIDGVVIPTIENVRERNSDKDECSPILVKSIPYAGYYKVPEEFESSNINIKYIPYELYKTI
ncbi:hypothetical protein N9251_00680 [Gammaproteobacteria bacterium]|nr:hypothetical protein [Gammaproteobacteria bacterium]